MGNLPELKKALEAKRNFNLNMFIGLDGFVDEILHVVDKRLNYKTYSRVNTIAALGERISRAAGLGTNMEFVPVLQKLGGNGTILSNALIEYGVHLTYSGCIGKPEIHPVFKEMANRCAAVYSLCEPAHTDALEFEDGKLMLGKHSVLKDITWDACKKEMGGAAGIANIVSKTHLFGMENWTMIPMMSDIWQGLIDEVFPLLPNKTGADRPLAFFDLADPEKRTRDDILRAMKLIGQFEKRFRVILGLNEKETYEIAQVFGVNVDETLPSAEKLRATVLETYRHLNIYCLVSHPTKSACCAVNGEYFTVDGPYCAKPVLTTGAGDNFNAGFCLGQALGLSPVEALTLGVSTSGFYVRNGKSPTFEQVIGFVQDWEDGKLK